MIHYPKFVFIILGMTILLLTACAGDGEGESVSAAVSPAAVKPTTIPSPTFAVTATAEPTAAPQIVEQVDAKANADVLFVSARLVGENTWTFRVTVEHPDTGWEDYADGWDVLLPDGSVLKPDPESPFTRLLLHPHENEQPFTRSQSNILIPPGTTQVTVRAHDIVAGFGGLEIIVDLTAASGTGFEVLR